MDRITKDYISNFLSMYEIESEGETKNFEKFCAYCALKKDYSKNITVEQIEDMVVADPSDTGIDAIALIINNQIVTEIEEIDEIIEKTDEIKVTFIFVQSKNKDNFARPEFRDFTGGVLDLFNEYLEKPTTRQANNKIKSKINLITHLLKKCIMKFSGRPICKLYYFLTFAQSNLLAENKTQNLINSEQKALENTNLFDHVVINVEGIKYIQNLYRNTLSRPKVSISFPLKTPLPEIENIKEAFIGILPFSEFRKVIIDDSDNIRESVFEENVRSYYENFPVNKDIKKTIIDGKIDRFVVLNNGITIVAKALQSVGATLILEDYQIVNGCQTSHVLYESRNILGIDNINITVKIIHTNDQQIINSIITATNNQTQVNSETLSSLLDFQKTLESFYNTYTILGKDGQSENRLYYERQAGQYIHKGVTQSKVISIKNQAKCFAAMFLDLPHQSAREYGKIKEKIGNKIFSSNHEPLPYYTSALTYYEVYKILRNKTHQLGNYQKFKFHILMLIRYLICGCDLPDFDKQKINDYSKKIIKLLESITDNKNKNELLNYIDKSINIIENSAIQWAQDLDNLTEEPIKHPAITQSSKFTELLKNYLKERAM